MRRLLVQLLVASLAGAIALTLACQRPQESAPSARPPADPPWFVEVTEERGLHFVHDPGPVGDYLMPEQVGSGAALFDFDKDGLLDLYLLQNGGPNGPKNCLYRGLPGGRFEDVSKGSGLDFASRSMGVAVGDVNNDGWPDVLVTGYDGIRLFLNNGDRTFTEVTKEAGLSNPAWGTSAAFLDYDRDGWLDLVVVNYVDYDPTWPCNGPLGTRDYCAPKTFKGRVTRLFHNLGRVPPPVRRGQETRAERERPARRGSPDPVEPGPPPPVRFADVTESSGLGRLPGPGLGVVCADFDGDGWPDIFVANDGARNHLWINHRDGTFKEEALQRGLAYNGMAQAQAGMGVALGDVDGDGLFDLFVSHLAEETHTLWKQQPRGLFRDQTAAAGLITTSWRGTGFGTLLADFDHDGALDLALVNGRVSARPTGVDPALGPFWTRYGDRNQLFRGDGRGRFQDISLQNDPFCGRYNVARGLVRGDIDRDGAQDLLVTTIGGPARLFRNVAPKRGHWLVVRAFDPARNRDAIGAEVRVRAGGRTWTAWLHPAESYLCSSEPVAHFGLGDAERVESVEVFWPDGAPEAARETFPGCPADQRIELRRGQGRPVAK